MASPFKVFRKHQKAWLAVLGISTMFAFIVLPNVMQNMGGRGPRTDLAVITSKYGDLTGRELQSLRLRNRHLGEFLISLRKAVQDSMPDTENSVDLPGLYEDWRNGVNIAGRAEKVDLETLFKYWSVADPMIRGASDGGASEEITVDIWLRAHRAEELGLVVSDQMVFDFLGGFTAGRVQPDVIERLHKKAELSESQLFEAIRSQLLADKLQQMFLTTLGPITPAQRWDYYRRLHRIVTAEVTAIPVNDFVDEVNGWSDEELEDFCSQRQDELAEFFARHKYQIDNPHRPEPGFKQPHRIDVEYVVARHEDFEPYVDVDKFDRSTLSDDEKFQHYIEMMQKSPSLGMPPDTTSPTGDQPDTGEPATPETPEAKPADTGEPATPETPEAKPADTGEPATQESTSPEAEPTGESTDSTPTPPTPKADDGKASDNDTDDPATGETSLTKPSPFQWVSFQQEGEAAGEPAETET
ncbi:MAG: hypothetical protein HQ581_11445, partial [Planctomycetes bacterium]|nr:hypothetical protein [Planctomycetota bacterium]